MKAGHVSCVILLSGLAERVHNRKKSLIDNRAAVLGVVRYRETKVIVLAYAPVRVTET